MFTILHVAIMQAVLKGPVPCGYLLFIILTCNSSVGVCTVYAPLCQSSLGIADHFLSHVAHVTTAAYSFERSHAWPTPSLSLFIFSLSGFAFSDVAKICIFMILYDLCLLPAQFRYVIINIRYLENHVQLVDLCASSKFSNIAENFLLQALQF
jgi:hypothetical protein